MGSIGRYIFRTTFGAFLLVLVSVTMLMWITQALRNIDLMTGQGQTILVFIGITGLIIPLLILLIAPIALMIAVAYVLNKLSNDSELIVMNAAGMSPWRVFRPFLAVTIVISILVGAISTYLSPKSLRELRRWATEVRNEVLTSTLQPGQFASIYMTTVHVRDLVNGRLLGIMIDDRRDQKERVTILAETGNVLTNENGAYLILANGTIQRHEAGQRDPAIVAFKEYAVDLSTISPTVAARFSVQERFTSELLNPAPGDELFRDQPGQFRAELHNRLTAPLYPLAFLVVTFAFLGAPRTTRQGRVMSFIGAIAVVAVIRGFGFLGSIAGVSKPAYLAIPYAVVAVTIVLGFFGIARGITIEPPALLTNAINAVGQLLMRLVTRRAALPGAAQ